jgi:hypothetical protein
VFVVELENVLGNVVGLLPGGFDGNVVGSFVVLKSCAEE